MTPLPMHAFQEPRSLGRDRIAVSPAAAFGVIVLGRLAQTAAWMGMGTLDPATASTHAGGHLYGLGMIEAPLELY